MFMEKKKLILIDDEVDFLEIAKSNLKMSQNYEILTLETAKDVLKHIHEFEPDIILMDIVMPDIDGIEATRLIRSDPAGRKVPIIILSAMEGDDVIQDAKEAGVNDYVFKPITTNDLIAHITKALENSARS